MSYPQSTSNSYYNNHEETDDSNSVFDADTVVPDEVPSLPRTSLPLLTANKNGDHRQLCNNNEAPSSSQSQESPPTSISELLRRIKSRPPVPSPSINTATTTTTTVSNKEKEVSSNQSHPPSLSSSSSSKRLLRRYRSSRNQQELQKKQKTSTQPRRSSRVKAKPADQSYVDNSDPDDDEFEDHESDDINPSSSSRKNFTSTSETNSVSFASVNRPRRSSRLKAQPADQSYAHKDSDSEPEYEDLDQSEVDQEDQPNTIEATVINNQSSSSQSSRIAIYDTKWKRKFRELCAYKELHGHIINIRCSDKQLGSWVNAQRQEYKKWKKNKKSKITKERIRMLNSIDFQWRIRYGWDEKFKELCAFKEKHNHVNVPQNNKDLGQWVSNQRLQYKRLKDNTHSYMTEEHIQKLESVGFKWVGHNLVDGSEWSKRFSELSDFKDIHGHVNVPYSHSDKRLSNWVVSQRYQYNRKKANKSSNMTRERSQMLESIGFEWSLPRGSKRNESEWDKKFAELCEYKELHGNANVTRENKNYKSLGIWVHTQREQFRKLRRNKKSAITENRIQLLNSIGFRWVRGGKK